MAFGTGHHATTSLMLDRLLDADLAGIDVIDMGTGTGILAILAAMRGAGKVTGIEIDEMAYVNAVENTKLNNHSEIDIRLGDASQLNGIAPADLFLANINRNIITADIASYANAMKSGARIFLSGFYVDDVPVIRESGEAVGLKYGDFTERDKWCSVMMIKQ